MKKTFYVLFIFFSAILFGQKQLYLFKQDAFGDFFLYVETNTEKNTFTVYSNPNSITNNLSQISRFIIKNSKKNNGGSIIKINDGTISSGIYTGTIESFSNLNGAKFKASKEKGDELKGSFFYKSRQLDFIAKPVDNYYKIRDFDKIAISIEKTIRNNIYNAQILNKSEWKDFSEKLRQTFQNSNDDLDIMANISLVKKKLNTSHINFFKVNKNKSEVGRSSNFEFLDNKNNSTILKINEFSLNDVDSINHCISNIKTQNLIIDLRDCGGGDFSSIILASHFIKEEKMVGYFLGNKYYNKTQKLPTKEELNQLKPFEGKTVTDLYNAIANEGIVKAVAKPIFPFYGGKVWVLTNKNTASACEPLVDFLKINNLATIIGEKTAGKMLSAKSFPIDENYELYLPIGNYYTAQNFWIEQNGVEPNIAIKSENALDKVSELISK